MSGDSFKKTMNENSLDFDFVEANIKQNDAKNVLEDASPTLMALLDDALQSAHVDRTMISKAVEQEKKETGEDDGIQTVSDSDSSVLMETAESAINGGEADQRAVVEGAELNEIKVVF